MRKSVFQSIAPSKKIDFEAHNSNLLPIKEESVSAANPAVSIFPQQKLILRRQTELV